jgi:type III restriction enzyme
MQSLYPEAAKAIDWADGRFDAFIEITSPAAAALRGDAEKLALAYVENSELVFEEENPFTVGPVLVNPAKAKPYQNALHGAYDLNPLEHQIAEVLDATGFDWARNPVNGGFAIPLLDIGDKRRFFPDFLVWKDDVIFALDPKGGHLLAGDAGKKLMNIQDEKGQRKVVVRFISEGRFNDDLQKLGSNGFTVFSSVKSTGKIRAKAVTDAKEAVEVALKP